MYFVIFSSISYYFLVGEAISIDRFGFRNKGDSVDASDDLANYIYFYLISLTLEKLLRTEKNEKQAG